MDWFQYQLNLLNRYAGAEEIWKFYRERAEEYGLYEHTKFSHRVIGATWDEDVSKWTVRVEDVKTKQIIEDSAEVVINCAGVLKYVRRTALGIASRGDN